MKQTIEIPLPPIKCSPNALSPGNWRAKSEAIKQYRSEAFYAAKAAGVVPMDTPVRLSVVFYMAPKLRDGRYRPLDIFNGLSALKGACDGIIDAGIIPDDNYKFLMCGSVTFFRTMKEHGGKAAVVLTFEEVGDIPREVAA